MALSVLRLQAFPALLHTVHNAIPAAILQALLAPEFLFSLLSGRLNDLKDLRMQSSKPMYAYFYL